MTVCPVAMAVGCKKCPIVGFCPLKTVIGDYPQDTSKKADAAPEKTRGGNASRNSGH